MDYMTFKVYFIKLVPCSKQSNHLELKHRVTSSVFALVVDGRCLSQCPRAQINRFSRTERIFLKKPYFATCANNLFYYLNFNSGCSCRYIGQMQPQRALAFINTTKKELIYYIYVAVADSVIIRRLVLFRRVLIVYLCHLIKAIYIYNKCFKQMLLYL